MYERRHHHLISRVEFFYRVLRHVLVASGIVFLALGAGILGYHYTENLPWLDSLLNASMILGGMGPVNKLRTPGGKLFASFYALFSGLAFISIMAVLLAPFVHRFLHRFHLEVDKSDS
jgi:hypothetical protein